jgi:hypothetical protein
MTYHNDQPPPTPPRSQPDTVRVVAWLVGVAMVLVALVTVLVVALD